MMKHRLNFDNKANDRIHQQIRPNQHSLNPMNETKDNAASFKATPLPKRKNRVFVFSEKATNV